MMNNRRVNEENGIQDLNIIDLILMDHRFLKTSIEVLIDDGADRKRKLSISKDFLDAVALHSSAEKKAVYANLENHPELHFNILEARTEHELIDHKVKVLRGKVSRTRVLRDKLSVELKVLAELLKHHLMEEESETLPRMDEAIGDETLREIGKEFMKVRKFSVEDFKDYPLLQDELIQWKDSIQKVSSEFLTKMDKFVEGLHH